jgi:hypothetical protein
MKTFGFVLARTDETRVQSNKVIWIWRGKYKFRQKPFLVDGFDGFDGKEWELFFPLSELFMRCKT